jgi:hypothetical protein
MRGVLVLAAVAVSLSLILITMTRRQEENIGKVTKLVDTINQLIAAAKQNNGQNEVGAQPKHSYQNQLLTGGAEYAEVYVYVCDHIAFGQLQFCTAMYYTNHFRQL